LKRMDKQIRRQPAMYDCMTLKSEGIRSKEKEDMVYLTLKVCPLFTHTPIFMNKMLALKFVLSIVSRHLIGQF
jgi:hypothetical protein